MFSLFNRKLHKKILILCALPLDKNYVKFLYEGNKSDFINSIVEKLPNNDFVYLWDNYRSSAYKLRKLLNSYQSAGATIRTDFNCCDLSKIDSYDVVILIAHHVRGCDEVEFCGEQVKASQIIGSIPANFSGIFDISSCYSSSFQLEIKMRAPSCNVIATDTETSLNVRLTIYEHILKRLKHSSEEYHIAFRNVIYDLLNRAPSNEEHRDLPIHLGGEQFSTIFAPSSVCKGETFIVQLFLHKNEDSEEVEIQAKMVDDSAEKRNSKPISIRLKKGDKIDVSLQSNSNTQDDFIVHCPRQSVVWQNVPCSAEFAVSVNSHCSQSSFCGIVMLAVNKIPAGTMMFRSRITDYEHSNICAAFECKSYDKDAEMKSVRNSLCEKMQHFLDNTPDQMNEEAVSQKEMCKLCLDLLSKEVLHSKNIIPRVFISSTSDMVQYRKVIEERVKACEMFPDMYELWGQGNEYPRDMCCKHVLQSDFFICILGSKYGFIEPIWDKSMTEIEYRVAQSAGIPALVYVLNENVEIEDRQNAFLNEVKTQRMVGMFKDPMSLALMANSELLTLKHTQYE